MASNQQNITGLLLAKREQVKALQDLGFSDITESSRASLFAERIRRHLYSGQRNIQVCGR